MGAFDGVRLDVLIRLVPVAGRQSDPAEDAVYMVEYSTREPLASLPVVTYSDVAREYGLLTKCGQVVDPRLSAQ